MTTESELIALAERCEAATGPDRELDLCVKAAVYGGSAMVSPFNGEWCLYREATEDPRKGRVLERPRSISHATWIADAYTASLDAAMTLYIQVPPFVPSCPRKATSEALRQRAEVANV